jgi:hypothetical protein
MASEHYIAFNDAIRQANAMLNNKELKSVMEGVSEEKTRQLKEYIKVVARGKVETPADPTALGKTLDVLRKNYVLSVLGLNVVTTLKQPASLMQGLAEVNKGEAVKAGLTLLSHPLETNAFIDSKSTMMRNRSKSFEREMAEIAEKRKPSTMLGQKSLKDYRELSMIPIQIADKTTTNLLWLAKYNEIMKATNNEQQAIKDADAVIRNTQPMGGIVNLPAAHRGGQIGRLFTTFTNQLNQNANMLYEMQQTWGDKSGKRKLEETFFRLFMPSLMIYLASNGFNLLELKDDPEGAIKALINNVTGGFPILNTVIDTVMTAIGNETRAIRGLPKERIFSSMLPAPLKTIETILEGFTASTPERKIMKGIQAGALATGIPYAQPSRTIEGMDEFMETGDPRNLIWKQDDLRGNQKPTRRLLGTRSQLNKRKKLLRRN